MNNNETMREYLRERQRLWALKGKRCAYCGKKAVELHHIVPRHMGGDNRPENIIPLCRECHNKAHSKRTYEYQTKQGRKRIDEPYNFKEVANDYLNCEISFGKALALTGLKKNTFYRMLKEYKESSGDTRYHRDYGIVRDEYSHLI